MLPLHPPIPKIVEKKKVNNNKNKIKAKKVTRMNKQKNPKQTDTQTKKQTKTSHQRWCQNLQLWTVAVHMCYMRLTLSLTTVGN